MTVPFDVIATILLFLRIEGIRHKNMDMSYSQLIKRVVSNPPFFSKLSNPFLARITWNNGAHTSSVDNPRQTSLESAAQGR
jgi:hypothetical protein